LWSGRLGCHLGDQFSNNDGHDPERHNMKLVDTRRFTCPSTKHNLMVSGRAYREGRLLKW
jgi:hypothetical protein